MKSYEIIKPQETQKNFLLMEKIFPGSINNHKNVAIEIRGVLDVAIFNQALQLLIERHDMLRAVISDNEGNMGFNILPNLTKNPLLYLEAPLNHLPALDKLPETLKSLNYAHFFEQPFDITQGPLWRVCLVKMQPQYYQLVFLFNHVIIDEHSIRVIFEELSILYNNLKQKSTVSLQPLGPLSTLSFELPMREVQDRTKYWEKILHDLKPLTLFTDFEAQSVFNYKGKRHRLLLKKELIDVIENNDYLKPYTLKQIMLANLHGLLFRMSGEDDICTLMTVDNRESEKLSKDTLLKTVNCFFNTLPIKTSPHKQSFIELLDSVKSLINNGLENQLPLNVILDKAMSPENKASGQHFFNVLFSFNEKGPTLSFDKTETSAALELDLGLTKLPYFSINLTRLTNGDCQGAIEYNTNLFKEESIERFAQRFLSFLMYFSKNPQSLLQQVPLLLPEEEKLIFQFNNTDQEPKIKEFLPDFFHEQALSTPYAIALNFHGIDDKKIFMSYYELDTQSTQLANYLKSSGITKDDIVGIAMKTSPQLIISILAAFKSGATLLILETEPNAMLTQKLNTTPPKILLVNQESDLTLAELSQNKINIDDLEIIKQIKLSSLEYVSPEIKEQESAYVCYTSGSTGVPKAVEISQAGLFNTMNAIKNKNLPDKIKVLSTAYPCNDAFLYDILVGLVFKGELHLVIQEHRYSPSLLSKIIQEEQIYFAVFFSNILAQIDPNCALKYVISMGAIPNDAILKEWLNAVPNRILQNDFGPTETTICATEGDYEIGLDHRIIGKPIANMKAWVLDSFGFVCPPGIPGGLYLSGPGVAKGYANNPVATQQSFINTYYDECQSQILPLQSSNLPLLHLYMTGDHAVYDKVGDELKLKFIGRKDDEVKICGVRLNLQAIKNTLLKHKDIKDIALLPNKELTSIEAYAVLTNEKKSPKEIELSIRQFLTTTWLPIVAYPHTIHFIPEQLPLTTGGKLNLKALAELTEIETKKMQSNITKPMAPLEKGLANIWKQLLNKTDLPTDRTFQELGGNSSILGILETKLNKIRNELNLSTTKRFVIGNELTFDMTLTSLAQKLSPYLRKIIPKKMIDKNAYRLGRIIFFNNDEPVSPANKIVTKFTKHK